MFRWLRSTSQAWATRLDLWKYSCEMLKAMKFNNMLQDT